MPKQQQASVNQTSHPFFMFYGAVPPCYRNFDKQSTAPLVTIPSPMVMPIFVAQNPQLSYTTPNISVLEVADSRKPLTSSLETTYATPRQAAVGAPIDMAGTPSRTAIPHLARSIPLRLDDLCINTLPLCYRQHQSIPPDREEFFIRSHRPNQLRKYSCPDLDYGTSVHFTSPSGWQRLAQASVPNSIPPGGLQAMVGSKVYFIPNHFTQNDFDFTFAIPVLDPCM